ncbi:MAG: T9SS type A sorting domain-containing protein, partial [Prolixibacteraceae bacterium]|nr:T9SS type A sorting domain-containing protein [Prolixibacteraceae bacterium]
LNDAEANSQIDILGTHLYGTPKANYYYPQAVAKNKEIWMTEHLLGSNDPVPDAWSLAMEIADEINLCMDASMSAFVYWYIHRFYGLIDDGGNITNKGYVMSQFAKFVRPGAYRVYADFDAVSKVTTTAYRTDTSLAIVVVNHNRTSVDVNFNIENNIEGITSLTQFTTTETKRVYNDGIIELNNGSFSATVDAISVTTFTSDASNGSRFGNEFPVASGGGDIEILDTLGTKYSFTLKGSESFDPDGEIVKYSWSLDGNQISTSPDIDISVGLGRYEYILTVFDNDGAVDRDTIKVNIYNLNSAEIWLEAECTKVGSNWNQLYSSSCSNSKYLTVKTGIQSTSGASTNTNDHLIYSFYLPYSGNYKIWGRVLAPSADDDSYWIKVDNGSWINWNSIVGGSDWQWDDVHNQSNDNPMVYALDSGYHTLSVCFREDGAAIDKFYITNNGTVPAGMGEDAENCDINNSVDGQFFEGGVYIYPNPVGTSLGIEGHSPFRSIEIFDSRGCLVMTKEYENAVFNDIIQVNLVQGIYIIKFYGDSFVSAKRFMVK